MWAVKYSIVASFCELHKKPLRGKINDKPSPLNRIMVPIGGSIRFRISDDCLHCFCIGLPPPSEVTYVVPQTSDIISLKISRQLVRKTRKGRCWCFTVVLESGNKSTNLVRKVVSFITSRISRITKLFFTGMWRQWKPVSTFYNVGTWRRILVGVCHHDNSRVSHLSLTKWLFEAVTKSTFSLKLSKFSFFKIV